MVLNNIEVTVLEELEFEPLLIGSNQKIYTNNSCIYCLFNKVNNKFYLGSTIKLKTRISKHRRDCEKR